MNVERKKRKGGEDSYLVIDGEPIKDSSIHEFLSRRHGWVYDETASARLAKHRFEDFEPHFDELSLWFDFEWNDMLSEVRIQFRDAAGKNDLNLSFEFRLDWEQWARPYSIAQYAEALREATETRKDPSVTYYENEEFITNGFGFKCKFCSLNAMVEDEVLNWSNRIRLICSDAVSALNLSLRKNSVVTWFDFPLGVRTACEQYLLYFVQFLEDLGIEANAEITEETRRVLFCVTPTEGPTALDQIRQALEIYLRLPGMRDFDRTANHYPNLAVQQLQANILHLKSQVILKEATIEALRLSNFQYRQLLTAEKKTDETSEALFGDTVYVTKIEGKGVMIDLPLILKRLKRAFGYADRKAK